MSIESVTNNKGETVYKYFAPPLEVTYEKCIMLSNLFDKYLAAHRLTKDDIIVNKHMIGKLADRVEKRKDYFIIFHDETYINEIKEIALFAYWIIKMSPFTLKYDQNTLNRSKLRVNEGFAAFLILGTVKEVYKRSHNGKKLKVSKDYCIKLMYALKYWDLSKEALIMIAETLNV